MWKIACPYSKARLEELYVYERRSYAEIARLASVMEEWPYTIAYTVVRRWIRESGIQARSVSEAKGLPSSKRKGSEARKASKKAVATRRERYGENAYPAPSNPGFLNKRTLRRAVKASVALAHAKKVRKVFMLCEWCEKEVWREPYKFKSDHVFCSKSCRCKATLAVRYANHRATETRWCEFCGISVTRPASEFRHDHVYCSRSCAAKASQKRRGSILAEERAALPKKERPKEMPSRQKRVTSPCQRCGTPVTRRPCEMRGPVYCSKSCSMAHRWEMKRAQERQSPKGDR